jgi:proteasome lid subunit RPN8/RPN11
MSNQQVRYVLDLRRTRDDAGLGQFPLSLDLAPAAEWGRLVALRRWLDPKLASEAQIEIEPIWHTNSGAPYIEGLRVTAHAEHVQPVSAEIPAGYFRPNALRIADCLVSEEKMEAGDLFTYAVLAFPSREASSSCNGDLLEIEDLPVQARLQPGSLHDEIERAIAFGDLAPEVVPIFVPQQVIDEVVAAAERADEVEVGAVLIGKMHVDTNSKDLFLKVTAQIPARHTLSESTKLSFSAETWAGVQAAIELRRSNEQMLGWFHSHPARHWCNKECAPEAKRHCPLGTPFFSRADCDLHRVAFCQPHCVALLATSTYSGMKLTMYGWNRAMITQRGFYIIKADTARALPATEAESIIGTNTHEPSCHP